MDQPPFPSPDDAALESGRTTENRVSPCRFTPSPAGGGPVWYLVPDFDAGASSGPFAFTDQLEIGRDESGRAAAPGQLLVRDSSVSFRHCIITRSAEGACYVRDVSRNGTRIDGRRLVPNIECEIQIGQTLEIGAQLHFVLQGEASEPASGQGPRGRTSAAPHLTLATVLVGDIRDYTVLVRRAPAVELQQSVSRVFERLTALVTAAGGTVKEFPGDAMLAFWEGDYQGQMTLAAARAAIALDRATRRLAKDPAVWTLRDFPLRMDWALATGEVTIDSFGGATPVGLSMVGEPVVLACRLEKFATDETGPILACPGTRSMAALAGRGAADGPPLEFRDLGTMQAKGFDKPDRVFALKVPDD